MIKKVAVFSTSYDGKKLINVSCKQLYIFNPNSKYSSPEHYVSNKILQSISDKDVDMQNCKRNAGFIAQDFENLPITLGE